MASRWDSTVTGHRLALRDAVLDVTAELIEEKGLRGLAMSQIAERVGIGRATLYRHFPDVDSIVQAWHERQVSSHLDRLVRAQHPGHDPAERLRLALETFAASVFRARKHLGVEQAVMLHRSEHTVHARQHLRELIENLLVEGAEADLVRHDTPPAELASFCLHSLAAAADLETEEAVDRLVELTIAALRP